MFPIPINARYSASSPSLLCTDSLRGVNLSPFCVKLTICQTPGWSASCWLSFALFTLLSLAVRPRRLLHRMAPTTVRPTQAPVYRRRPTAPAIDTPLTGSEHPFFVSPKLPALAPSRAQPWATLIRTVTPREDTITSREDAGTTSSHIMRITGP